MNRYLVFIVTLFLSFLIFVSSTTKVEAYLIDDDGSRVSCPTACSTPNPGTCAISEAGNCGTCGTSSTDCCASGSPWTRYVASCKISDPIGGLCDWYWVFDQQVCSTADKCETGDGPYLRWGSCSCATGSVYKVCCNDSGGGVAGGACVQVSNDNIDPPYEGVCPAGSHSVFGTDASACGAVATPTPTPTPRPSSPCTGSSSCQPAASNGASCGSNQTYQYNSNVLQDNYCNDLPNGNFSPYCFTCVSGASPTTALPQPTVAPTSPPTGNVCGGGIQCPPSAACYAACCTCSAGWGVCDSCTGGGTPPPACDTTTLQLCGVCNVTPASCGGGCSVSDVCGACVDNNSLCSSGQVCTNGTCTAPRYIVAGYVYNDTNNSGSWDFSCYNDTNFNRQFDAGETQLLVDGTLVGQQNSNDCRTVARGGSVSKWVNGKFGDIRLMSGSEASYFATALTVTISGPISGWSGNATTNTSTTPDFNGAKGGYTFGDNFNPIVFQGNHTVTLTPPSGYTITSPNPALVTVNGFKEVDFGISQILPPSCSSSLSATPNNDASGSYNLTILGCTNVPTPPPSPFTWSPDVPPVNNPPPAITGQTDFPVNTPTQSTTTWTPPACQPTSKTYNPQVVVGSVGNFSPPYTTSITVPASYTVTTNVISVTDTSSCPPGPGKSAPYGGATLNLSGTRSSDGSSYMAPNTSSNSSGVGTFACVPGGNYQVSIGNIPGYSVTGVSGGTFVSPNGVNINPLTSDKTVTLCIAPINPWFQTDIGDVRFLNLTNPVPPNKYASLSNTYPGIFYSSDSTASFGVGAASAKNWVINNEYSYNANTQNRNGGMSYDFYKNKTRKDGVSITSLVPGTLDTTAITGSGVYESNGDLTINNYTHTPGRRVVILVNGNVTINTPISIPNLTQQPGLGNLFIVAAHGNITISKTIGTATLTSTSSNLDGYYTAQGSIILEGDKCSDGTTPDLRLNVGGVLIANSLKPFSTTGTGTIRNQRSLCTNNLQYPSLYISSRPDFLTQLTDFYKTSYTKWQEVNP